MNLYKSQPVKYVTADNKTVDAVIEEVFGDDRAHVIFGENGEHRANARYSEAGEPNTFSIPDDGSAGKTAAVKPAPFAPGAGSAKKTKETKNAEPAAAPA